MTDHEAIMIAALYIDPRGPYPKIPGVECWDETRDARKYDGPHAVVAHPPCGPWGRLRHLYRGAEHDCAPRAVEQVRRRGGVLEHPAGSKLWEACGLPKPSWGLWEGGHDLPDGSCAYFSDPDMFGGYTIELDQCEWGHVARKRTWLYLAGVPCEALEAPPYPGRAPTHDVSRDASRARRNGYTKKRTSSRMNLLTPPDFAAYLVRLARSVRL